VGRQPREQRARANAMEMPRGEHPGRLQCRDAKARHQKRVPRNAKHRPQAAFGELPPAHGKRLHELSPVFAIGPEFLFRHRQVALQHDGGSIVERVGTRRFSMHPFEAVLRQRERVEER